MQYNSIDDLVLHVGLDDSNHAGERKGEIIVATFSFDPEDCIKRKHGARANYLRAKEWLTSSDKNYRFTILLDEQFRHLNTNLSQYTPDLVKSFLENYRRQINSISLNFDGKLSIEERASLMKSFNKLDNLEINNFPKAKHKNYNCPLVVYMADTIAHHLYQRPLSSLLEDKRYVSLKT